MTAGEESSITAGHTRHTQEDLLFHLQRSIYYGRFVVQEEPAIKFPAFTSFKMEDWIARKI